MTGKKSLIWIVDDDRSIRFVLEKSLSKAGFDHESFATGDGLLERLKTSQPDVIISDIRMPGINGLEVLEQVQEAFPNLPVIIMTAHSDLSSAVKSYKRGAFEYLPKPFDVNEAVAVTERAVKHASENKSSKSETVQIEAKEIIGEAPAMQEVFRAIGRLSHSNITVLIKGESGTGKELVARAVHEGSTRQDASLISVNCAAIPENLIESELFGHEKDAFPGATSTRTGLVEEANNGTLFLDEIGELPLEAQARLLRVLQEHEIRKVGSVQSQKVDIRLVAATHRDLKQLVNEGRFREDLYYRINVMPLEIPPLRARGADVLELADRKLEVYCNRLNVPRKKFSPDAIQGITTYHWPGNVRELENAIERAVILTEENEIPLDLMGLDVELVKIDAVATATPAASNDPDHAVVNDKDLSLKDYFERFVLENQDELNETELAKKLGISRKCLWERRQRFNIPRNKKKPA